MHLHGFYFRVMRVGDGRRDEPIGDGARPTGRDAAAPVRRHDVIQWTPERDGNWLFHCHIMAAPVTRASPRRAPIARRRGHGTARTMTMPAGSRRSAWPAWCWGLACSRGRGAPPPVLQPHAPRLLTMVIGRRHDPEWGVTAMGVAISETRAPELETHDGLAGSPAGAEPRRARRDYPGEPPRMSPRRSTGMDWRSRATTTACTAGAGWAARPPR